MFSGRLNILFDDSSVRFMNAKLSTHHVLCAVLILLAITAMGLMLSHSYIHHNDHSDSHHCSLCLTITYQFMYTIAVSTGLVTITTLLYILSSAFLLNLSYPCYFSPLLRAPPAII